MAFDDTEWPAYGTWVCDRDSGPRELIHGEWRPEVVKACTFPGCKGVMTLNDHLPWLVRWFCEVSWEHFEFEKPCTFAGCKGVMTSHHEPGVIAVDDFTQDAIGDYQGLIGAPLCPGTVP
jgi:hypothetical protein